LNGKKERVAGAEKGSTLLAGRGRGRETGSFWRKTGNRLPAEEKKILLNPAKKEKRRGNRKRERKKYLPGRAEKRRVPTFLNSEKGRLY